MDNMFFDYSGCGNSYRGISVDPSFRMESGSDRKPRPNNSCCDRCSDNRPENNCRPNSQERNSYASDRCDDRHQNNMHNDGAENGNCCAEGVMSILSIATRTLGRNDTVDVEITLSGGYSQVVTLGRGTSTLISGDILKTPQGAVSLCEITKIRLLSSSVSDPEYMQRLQNELQRIIGGSMRRQPSNDCADSNCDNCVEAMQRYIMRNSDDVEALLFDGSQATTASVVTGTLTAPVISSADLTTDTAPFVTSAELAADTVEAVTAITAAQSDVVTDIELLPATLVSAIDSVTASVSGPVDVTDTDVVSGVDVTAVSEFASDISVTEATVTAAVTAETAEVVSGFSDPSVIVGVVSGILSAAAAAAEAVSIPVFSSVETGALQVVIPANAFATNIPATEVILPVTVGGSAISYGGTETAYVLSEEASLLSVTGTPSVNDIPLLGTPVTIEAVSGITATEATVAGDVVFTPVSGALVTEVSTASIGSAAQPETVEVITSVTTEFSEINGVGTVSTEEAAALFTTDTAAVLSNAQIEVTSAEAVSNVSLDTASANVVSGITTESVNVASPTFAEPIEGDIIGARSGIIAVDNTDGDLSVYSSCAVRGAQLDTTPQI